MWVQVKKKGQLFFDKKAYVAYIEFPICFTLTKSKAARQPLELFMQINEFSEAFRSLPEKMRLYVDIRVR